MLARSPAEPVGVSNPEPASGSPPIDDNADETDGGDCVAVLPLDTFSPRDVFPRGVIVAIGGSTAPPRRPSHLMAGPAVCARPHHSRQNLATATKAATPNLLRQTNPIQPIQRSQPRLLCWNPRLRRSPQIRCPLRALPPPASSAHSGDCSAAHGKSGTADNGSRRDKIAAGQCGRAADHCGEQFRNLPAAHHEDERSTHHVERRHDWACGRCD